MSIFKVIPFIDGMLKLNEAGCFQPLVYEELRLLRGCILHVISNFDEERDMINTNDSIHEIKEKQKNLFTIVDSIMQAKKQEKIREKINNLQIVKTNQEEECPVCISLIETNSSVFKLSCGHFFHKICLEECLKYKSSCPFCRDQITNISE